LRQFNLGGGVVTRKVVGVFVRFRAPLHPPIQQGSRAADVATSYQHQKVNTPQYHNAKAGIVQEVLCYDRPNWLLAFLEGLASFAGDAGCAAENSPVAL
jgi:hypothetical protein